MLIAKTKLNTTKLFISKTLIDSYANHDEFVVVNNTRVRQTRKNTLMLVSNCAGCGKEKMKVH